MPPKDGGLLPRPAPIRTGSIPAMDPAEGKAPPSVLRKVLERLEIADPGVIIGPGIGEDAAVVRGGDIPRLVLAADPITFPTPRPGWHSVIVNANDVAATGAEPRWYLSQILAPPGTSEEALAGIADGIADGCREVGAIPVGGHTEITPAVARPVVAGTMVGAATAERIKPGGGAEPGDLLLMTRGIAIEATSILARAHRAEVVREFGAEFADRCERFVDDPGISVVEEARIAAGIPGVHAMHDVTEGGVVTAIREMAEAAGAGCVVAETEIPRYHQSKQLARHFELDILGTLGSGALLIASSGEGADELLDRLREADIPAQVIGRFTQPDQGLVLARGTARRDMPVFEADELAGLRPPASPEGPE